MSTQACPHCQAPHDVAHAPRGQRLLCSCGTAFEVSSASTNERAPRNVVRAAVSTVHDRNTVVPEGSVARAPRVTPRPVGPAPGPAAAAAVHGVDGASFDGTFVPGSAPVLPGYQLLQVLGRGGMGEVWLARQESLGRTVAVKLLPPKLAQDPEFVTRFDKEATALAALSHPHIVQIIDRGRAGEHYYFVMEYVEGRSLREVMGRLAPLEALRIVLQVARAVQCAHEEGIVHRDLKPENILLDSRGHAKVADFGLAGIQLPGARLQVTATSVAMGTLNYMAPEQRRDAKHVDGRADLFSLGVVLYELLTGELPVGRFRLPSERNPELDPRVDAVVARMLENEPEARYPSAAEACAALEVLTGSSPSGAVVLHVASGAAVPAAGSSVAAGLRVGWRGVRRGLSVVGGLVVLGLIVRAVVGPVSLHVDGKDGKQVVIGAQGVHVKPGPKGFPPNTNAELFVAADAKALEAGRSQLGLRFDAQGTEELNLWAGSWKVQGGQLSVQQAGSESDGGRLVPRAYLAHRYYSSDDFSAQVLMDVQPLGPQFAVEEDAQHFGELAFRIKDLQVSAFAIPGVGMRLSWRYLGPDGEEIVGNSAQDLEDLVEDEMPVPREGPYLVRLQLERRKNGVEAQAFLNNQRYARKFLPGLQGRVAKVALGCRNQACTFDDLQIKGTELPRPRKKISDAPAE
ncbi:serine/threonine protein kinase [Aggregicoccus sp. 17bor-14]|uniref:serine/threonine-protein kinase n=1 Tax=Myxococcaceae TaxID=31 RepID=UPI00129C5E6D|nr:MULTISPECIES: serine/threonine-protein kinase [Myxococcaceae]MBF5040949.1 serine/threonine protein kinase [Simulacricoccus sp. 17bor-14]MRI86737.1 serine/threonine protein kinase [Aggregicoccus sp. 17bor-14]